MKLYARLGQSAVQNEEHGDFEVAEDGSVELPEPLALQLHATHIGGRQAWETDAERHSRTVAEEIERRRDPAAMYELMERSLAGDAKVDTAVETAVAEALAKAAEGQQAAIDAAVKAALDKAAADAAASAKAAK